MGFTSWVKDKAIGSLLKAFANNVVSDFGRIENIDLDSENKKIILLVWLKGEKEIISLEVTKYEVVKSNNKNYIHLHNISASREWIEVAINKYFIERQIEIPEQFAGVIKILL